MDSRYYALVHKLGWKSIKELIADETKMMVFKPLNELGLKYIYYLLIKNSNFTDCTLLNTTIDIRCP